MDIRLDKETFKALASGTRVDILKLLGQRRHMQTEIAVVLGLSTPTVKEHLDALEKAGLVERHEEGRKWKYYSLSKKGKGVLNPEEMKIWIVLGLFILSFAGGIVTMFSSSVGQFGAAESKMAMSAPAMEAQTLEAIADVAAIAPVQPMPWMTIFGVLSLVFLIVLVYFFVKAAQYKRQLGKSLTKK